VHDGFEADAAAQVSEHWTPACAQKAATVLGQELPVGLGTALASGDASALSDSLTTIPPQDAVDMKIGRNEMTVRFMKPLFDLDDRRASKRVTGTDLRAPEAR
jgi:hypothetical protein